MKSKSKNLIGIYNRKKYIPGLITASGGVVAVITGLVMLVGGRWVPIDDVVNFIENSVKD